MFELTVDVSGPFFDEVLTWSIIQDFMRAARNEIAAQALSDVQQRLNEKIQHPTPYYEVQVMAHEATGASIVTDRGIIYGYWLEGIGSQNSPVTSFAGYRAFTRAAAKARRQAGPLARHVLPAYVRELNG